VLQSAIGRLRVIGFIEGISYMLLVGIAMPLKYFAGLPMAVTIVGGLHGLLFVVYCLAVLNVWQVRKWGFVRTALAFAVSLVPIGTFLFDPSLKREQLESSGDQAV
jgi:integral membrane protein